MFALLAEEITVFNEVQKFTTAFILGPSLSQMNPYYTLDSYLNSNSFTTRSPKRSLSLRFSDYVCYMFRPHLMFYLIPLICSEALNTVRQEAQIIQRPQNSIPGPKFKEVG